jgi:hypothetical protein
LEDGRSRRSALHAKTNRALLCACGGLTSPPEAPDSRRAPTSVILTLENGENKQYDVPAGFRFDVDGRKLDAMELRPGMNLTATKIVESPRTEVTMDNVVTGVGPKKQVP